MFASAVERLTALYDLRILDTGRSPEFDAITKIAARHFDVPMCAVSLLDVDRQWFKSEVGLDCHETSRDVSFCHCAAQGDEVMVIPDATLDARFASNPLVAGETGIRFYAGCPIQLSPGVPLGTLCIIDRQPRTLSSDDEEDLKMFASLVEEQLRSHRSKLEAEDHARKQEEVAFQLKDYARKLERQVGLFEIAAKQAKLGAWEYDLESGEVLWSSKLHSILEIDETEITLRSEVLKSLKFPDWFTKSLQKADVDRSDYSAEVEMISGKGRRKWLGVHSRIAYPADAPPRRTGISIDITESKLRENSFQLLFDHNPLPMWVYEYSTQQFLAVNDAALRQYGYSREQFLSMDLFDIRRPEEYIRLQERLAAEPRPGQVAEDWVHQKADGTCFTASVYSTEIRYHDRVCAITAAIDVTEKRQHEEIVTHLAHHDVLTQLPNRRRLQTKLEECLVPCNQSEPQVGVLIIDFDNFKIINDTFGHEVGDQLIIGIAGRLKSALGPDDLLARLGGDEFAVIIDNAPDQKTLAGVAMRLVECARQPVLCGSHWINTSLSIGITLAPQDGNDANSMLRNADLALYRAKGEGRNTYRFFEPQMYLRLVERRELEQDLRHALERHEFEVHFQPIVDLKTELPVTYEALLRWNHPRRGRVPPAEFIPIAEEAGLIESISDWVLGYACNEATQWSQPHRVAVNVSAAQFTTGTITSAVLRALKLSGLAPSRLEIEITESLILENSEKNIKILHELHEMGVTLSLDDFGTGYSSLSRLQHLPVDKLKIDRSFVSGLGVTSREVKIIQAAISLGRSLQIITVAEGVETEEQAKILRRLGCNQAQGYYYGKPALLIKNDSDERAA